LIAVTAGLVRFGHALAYRQYSKHCVPIEAIAEWNKAGMWAGDFVAPWKWWRKKKRKELFDRIERGLEQDKRNNI